MRSLEAHKWPFCRFVLVDFDFKRRFLARRSEPAGTLRGGLAVWRFGDPERPFYL